MVTALFCDVTGSTALGEELDPEALLEVMNRYFAELRAVIERHGGTVAKFIGHAVMAAFGIPIVREETRCGRSERRLKSASGFLRWPKKSG